MFYYDLERAITTNGTTQTLSTHLRLLTAAAAAGKRPGWITALFPKARHGTAGGATARLITAAVAGSGGTGQTPAARHPNLPAADMTAFNDVSAITPGTTPTVRASAGFAQTGGQGAWVANERAAAISLSQGAGAAGNAEVASIAIGTSVLGDLTLEFAEA
ncbi:MAG: hypothetical protein ACRDGM_00725 [bacterium]